MPPTAASSGPSTSRLARCGETDRFLIQADGNFAAYNAAEEWIWSALHVSPDPSACLALGDDGVLTLTSGDTGAVLWASNMPVVQPVVPPAEQTAEPTEGGAPAPAEAPAGMVAINHQIAIAQPAGTTCADIPVAADGMVRMRINNSRAMEVSFLHVGTALAPTPPVLHFTVKFGQVVDVEVPAGTRWRVAGFFGGTFAEVTADASNNCFTPPVYRFRGVVAGPSVFIPSWQSFCATPPPSTADSVTLRFASVGLPNGPYGATITVSQTMLNGGVPYAVPQYTLASGESVDVETPIGSLWQVARPDGTLVHLVTATPGPSQCSAVGDIVASLVN